LQEPAAVKTFVVVSALLLAGASAHADETPLLFPTLALGIGLGGPGTTSSGVAPQMSDPSMDNSSSDTPAFFHSWVGVTITPHHRPVPIFFAVGAEIQIHDSLQGTIANVEPVVRMGLSAYMDDCPYLPLATVYVLAGVHVPSDVDPSTTRIGLGAALPALIGLAEYGVPNMLEVTLDMGGDQSVGALRVGWEI
jgi:hypothetical protein